MSENAVKKGLPWWFSASTVVMTVWLISGLFRSHVFVTVLIVLVSLASFIVCMVQVAKGQRDLSSSRRLRWRKWR